MAIKAGWTDIGNNLVSNTATGQVVDQNHPIYTSAPDTLGGTTAAAPSTDYTAPAAGSTQVSAQGAYTPPAGSTDPFAASGGGVFINGGWIPNNNPAAIASATATAGAPAGTAQPAQPAAGVPSASAPVDDAFRTQLLGLLNSSSQPVTPNDPIIQAQTDAYSSGRQLAQRQEQDQIAERMGAQGLSNSGAMDTATQGSLESMGRDVGGFQAQAMSQELSSRRQQLVDALSLAGGQLTNEEKNALQLQIEQIDDATKRLGIGVQQQLGQADVQQRADATNDQYSLGLLQALMGNTQFNDQLGFNMGSTEAALNAQALLNAMNG